MKKLLIYALCSFIACDAYSQENKPTEGAFGLRVGVNVPNVALGLTFSGMLKNNIEIGSSIGFGFSTSSFKEVRSGEFYTASQITIGTIETKSSSSSYSFFVSPIVLYHIPIKSNFDVYAGARLPFSVGFNGKYRYNGKFIGEQYLSETNETSKSPISYSIGATAVIGADYYFRKNMCIGVSGNIGFSSSFSNGEEVRTSVTKHSGINNPQNGTQNTNTYIVKRSNFNTSTGFNGSVGINFGFFFEKGK